MKKQLKEVIIIQGKGLSMTAVDAQSSLYPNTYTNETLLPYLLGCKTGVSLL